MDPNELFEELLLYAPARAEAAAPGHVPDDAPGDAPAPASRAAPAPESEQEMPRIPGLDAQNALIRLGA